MGGLHDDVADVLQIARTRILALLHRKGVLADDTVGADAKLGESEPALAGLAVASTLGTLPAGPALHRREPIALREDSAPGAARGLCATGGGFSLHAATTAGASDAAGREALCRYILRPPIAAGRVQLLGDDLVRLLLKRPFGDGTVAIDLDPLSLLCRLATAVPPPRFNTVRYAGVLAAASTWRPRVVPPLPPPAEGSSDDDTCPTCTAKDKAPTHRSGYRPWAELLKRTFVHWFNCSPRSRCDRPGARYASVPSARGPDDRCRGATAQLG